MISDEALAEALDLGERSSHVNYALYQGALAWSETALARDLTFEETHLARMLLAERERIYARLLEINEELGESDG